jgi:hypothetical protein
MALVIVIVVYVFVAAYFAQSLYLAYSMARNMNGGGYPILCHAVHNFIALLLASIVLPKVADVPSPLRVAAGIALWVVPAINALLIILLERLGERHLAASQAMPPADRLSEEAARALVEKMVLSNKLGRHYWRIQERGRKRFVFVTSDFHPLTARVDRRTGEVVISYDECDGD